MISKARLGSQDMIFRALIDVVVGGCALERSAERLLSMALVADRPMELTFGRLGRHMYTVSMAHSMLRM